jgi:hypothetical protein
MPAPQEYSERIVDVGDWQVRITSFRLGDEYVAKADNVSPGAWLARAAAGTKERAEAEVLQHATARLEKTRRFTT